MRTESRARHLRKRSFARARHDRSGLRTFLDAESVRLTGTETSQTFTATNATNLFTATAHGLVDGEGPLLVSNSGGALPTGLDANILYWARRIDANTFRLVVFRELSDKAIGEVQISDDGTGTQSIARAPTDEALFEWLRQRRVPRHIAAVADIDDL